MLGQCALFGQHSLDALAKGKAEEILKGKNRNKRRKKLDNGFS